jgi:hypothetical protein
MTQDYSPKEWLRIQKLLLSLHKLPLQEINAFLSNLPSQERAKLAVAMASRLPHPQGLQALETFYNLSFQDLASAIQIAPRDELERLILPTLESRFDTSAKMFLDMLSENELQTLTIMICCPKDILALSTFFGMMSRDRQQQMVESIKRKQG